MMILFALILWEYGLPNTYAEHQCANGQGVIGVASSPDGDVRIHCMRMDQMFPGESFPK